MTVANVSVPSTVQTALAPSKLSTAENAVLKGATVCCARSASPQNRIDSKTETQIEKQNQSEKFSNQIFVGGIPWKTTHQQFREWADATWPGMVTVVRLICTPEKSNSKCPLPARPRGFGFVTFNSPEVASNAVLKHHFVFSGERTVEVKKVEDPRDARRPSGKLNGDIRPKDNLSGVSSAQTQELEQPLNSLQPTNLIEVPISKTAGPSIDVNSKNQLSKLQPQAKGEFAPPHAPQSTDNIRPKSSSKPIRRNNVQRPVVSDPSISTPAMAVHDSIPSVPVSSPPGSTSNPQRPVKSAEINEVVKSTVSTGTLEVSTSKDTGPLYDSASRRFLRDRWEAAMRG